MNDLASVFEIVAALALVAAPPILLIRLLAGREGGGVAAVNLFGVQGEMPWPRGVQEEEPPRWRVELLERRPRFRADCVPSGADCVPSGEGRARVGNPLVKACEI